MTRANEWHAGEPAQSSEETQPTEPATPAPPKPREQRDVKRDAKPRAPKAVGPPARMARIVQRNVSRKPNIGWRGSGR